MKGSIIFLLSCCCAVKGIAQLDIDNVVAQVERNNKAIQSNIKYWEAKQAEFKTGLTLYDPQVEYDYMYGSPVGAGNQQDFAVTQRFDFPSAYKRKKELSNEQISQTMFQQLAYRQDVLLEAKLLTLQMIYLNKRGAEIDRRRSNTERLVRDLTKKFEQGEVIILDINKAKLQLLNIQNEVKLNENGKQVVLTKISGLNGGLAVVVKDTMYPVIPLIPDFEELDSTIEANDPLLKVFEQEKGIWQQQIALQKAMNLPKLETGYRSQAILGQNYKGVHLSVSVPLWENRHRLSAAKSNFEYAVLNAESSRLNHRLENREYYEQLDVRALMLQEYKELLTTLNNSTLLNKALSLGQITVVQYFYDESFYYTAYDRYLETEWQYQQALARLFKFQL